MRRNNWIVSLILVVASILFATSALARPLHDGQADEAVRYPFFRVLKTAEYNPNLLDYEFFEFLEAQERRSPEWRAFRSSLHHIDWYSTHFAREWINFNMRLFYRDFMIANRVSVFLDLDVPDELMSSLTYTIGYGLPEHAYLTNSAFGADIVISVDGGLGEPFVYERSAKVKTSKFKKKYRRTAASAGYAGMTYASYTRVKATAAMDYDIRLQVTSGYQILYQDRLYGRAKDKFKFVRDMRTFSASGEVFALLFPNGTVRKRFARNTDEYRAALYSGLASKIGWAVTNRLSYQGLPLKYALVGGSPYQRVSYGRGGRHGR